MQLLDRNNNIDLIAMVQCSCSKVVCLVAKVLNVTGEWRAILNFRDSRIFRGRFGLKAYEAALPSLKYCN